MALLKPLFARCLRCRRSTLALSFFCVLAALQCVASPLLDRELDLQEKRQREEQINRELQDNQRAAEALEPPEHAPAAAVPAEVGKSFFISRIEVDNGEFPDIDIGLSDIISRYQGRQLGGADLFALIREVSNRYAEKGFATTSIGLLPGSLAQGVVRLRVQWGKVEGYLIDGRPPQTWREHLMVFGAMPNLTGKPLNIRSVDQMIENLNTPAKSARIEIQPSTREGYSFLNLITQSRGLPDLTLRVDNSGADSPSNGRNRFSLSTSLGDLLLGNDSLGLNASSRRFQDDERTRNTRRD